MPSEEEQRLLQRLRGSGKAPAEEQSAYGDVMTFLWALPHWWCEHGDLMELSSYVLQFSNPTIEPFRIRMGEQLDCCALCASGYHGAKPAIRARLLAKYAAAGVERFFGKIRALDGTRLVAALSQRENSIAAFKEILQFPSVLQSAAVCAAVATFVSGLEGHPGAPDFSTAEWSRAKCPGVYQLMLHSDTQLRSWAHSAIQQWGAVETAEELEPLVEGFERCLKVLEEHTFRPVADLQSPQQLQPEQVYIHTCSAFWNGFCRILESIEVEPFKEVIMTQFPSLLDIVTIQLSAQNVTWQTVRCLALFVDRLQEEVWEYSQMSAQFLIDSVVSVCLQPNSQLEMLQRHSISLLDSAVRSLSSEEHIPELTSIVTFLLGALPASKASKTICTVAQMKGFSVLSRCIQSDIVLTTAIPLSVQALRTALQAAESTESLQAQALECLHALLWCDVRLVLQMLQQSDQTASALQVQTFEPLWQLTAQKCSSHSQLAELVVECQIALGSHDATYNSQLNTPVRQHLYRLRKSFSRCVCTFSSAQLLEAESFSQGMMYLLLCPHKAVRSGVEEAIKKLTRCSNKMQAISHMFTAHTAATVMGWRGALAGLLEVKPRNCFGSWLPVAQLSKMLPQLLKIQAVPKSDVDKINGFLWGIFRRIIQAASRFVQEAEYEPTMALVFDSFQMFWGEYSLPTKGVVTQESQKETLEMVIKLGGTCSRESLKWRWLKLSGQMCLDLETSRMLVPKASLVEASVSTASALQHVLSAAQLQQLRVAMPWLPERLPAKPAAAASKPPQLATKVPIVRQSAAPGQLTAAQLAEVTNRTAKARSLQQSRPAISINSQARANKAAKPAAPSQHWSAYLDNHTAAKPAAKPAAPSSQHWSAYVDKGGSNEFDKRSYAAPAELAQAKKPSRQVQVMSAPDTVSTGALRRHLHGTVSPAMAEKTALKALKRQVATCARTVRG